MRRFVGKEELKAGAVIAAVLLAVSTFVHPNQTLLLLMFGGAVVSLDRHMQRRPNSRLTRWLRR